jgi:hypothetical protein
MRTTWFVSPLLEAVCGILNTDNVPGAQTGRSGVVQAGEGFAWPRSLTGHLPLFLSYVCGSRHFVAAVPAVSYSRCFAFSLDREAISIRGCQYLDLALHYHAESGNEKELPSFPLCTFWENPNALFSNPGNLSFRSRGDCSSGAQSERRGDAGSVRFLLGSGTHRPPFFSVIEFFLTMPNSTAPRLTRIAFFRALSSQRPGHCIRCLAA